MYILSTHGYVMYTSGHYLVTIVDSYIFEFDTILLIVQVYWYKESG